MGGPAQPPAAPRLSALAEALDQLLLEQGAGAGFDAALLAFQCQLVNARAGVLLPVTDGGLGEATALWPGRGDGGLVAALAKTAAEIWEGAHEAAAAPLAASGAGALQVAVQPLRDANGPRALVAIAFDASSPFVVALAQERLELTSRLAWAFARSATANEQAARLRRITDVVEVVAAQDAHRAVGAAALELANEVQLRFGAERVAVGFARSGALRLEAVSHAERLSPQLGARHALETVLQRAVHEDRDFAIRSSRTDRDFAIRSQRPDRDFAIRSSGSDRDATIDFENDTELAGRTLIVMPLRADRVPIGAFALLCAPGASVDPADLEALRLVAELSGPRFGDRLEAEFAPFARLRRRFARGVTAMQREGRGWRVRAVPIAAGVVVAAALYPAPRRIEAPFVAQPVSRRIIAAPFDGKIAASGALPGDLVEAGKTEIARLETAELELQLAASRARGATERQRADLARGEGDPSGEQRAMLMAEQAAAETRLLEHRIAQARLVSPVTGVLLAGDLRQRIGAPVERGAVLAEVAPLEGMRAELSVPEDEVLDVAPGQRGTLATAARPGTSERFEVERIEPLAELRDGQNSFRVVVTLTDVAPSPDSALLPGMQGVAKIDAGRSPLGWQVLRRVVNALRMWLWI